MQGSKRVNRSALAEAEQKLLQFTVCRLPAWVTSDKLTAFGVFGAVLAFFSYWAASNSKSFLFLASVGIAINWFGDSLDGTLARFRGKERPRYGFFVDHSADLVSQVLIGVGFALSELVNPFYTTMLLASYLAFVAHTFIRARVFDVVQIAYFSVGPTETRLFLIASNMCLYCLSWSVRPLGSLSATPADLVCVGLAILSFGGLFAQIFGDWRLLSAEDHKQASVDQTKVETRARPIERASELP